MNPVEPGSPRSGLRWWHGAVFFLAALGSQFAIFFLIAILQLAGALGSTAAEIEAVLYHPGMLAVQVVVTCAVLVLLAVGAARLRRGTVEGNLRLGRPGRSAALVAGLGVIPVGIVIDEITFLLHTAAPGFFDAAGLSTFVQTFSGASSAGFIAATVAVTIGPALGEELFFRGLMLRALGADLPSWAAVAISSVLFGVLHLDMLQGTGAGLIGVYLAFAVLVTDSIWPAVIAHGVNNLLCSVLARLDPQGVGRAFSVGHPPWLVAAAALLTAVAILALWRLRVRPTRDAAAPTVAAR